MTVRPLVMPPVPPAHGDVLLRAFQESDVDMLRDLATDPYVPLTGSLPPVADRDQALGYVARQWTRLDTGDGYSWCIADRISGRGLGTAGLWLAQLEQGRASVGYAVAPQARGRGVARQALRALLGFAWSLPELHRVELYIEPWNTASVRTAEAAGCALEGLLRSHQQIGDRRVDMLLYAAVRPAPEDSADPARGQPWKADQPDPGARPGSASAMP